MEYLMTRYNDMSVHQPTNFGRIYYAREMNGRQVAIKENSFPHCSKLEAKFHGRLGKHPNIVEFLAYYENIQRSFIVMDWVDHGTLKELMDQQKTLTMRYIRPVFGQIVDAIEYIHSKNFVYRNLVPYHVLIDSISKKEGMTVKLCDFGNMRVLPDDKKSRLRRLDDFRSLGLLLFYMVTGTDVFMNEPEVYEKVAHFCKFASELIHLLVSIEETYDTCHIKSHSFFACDLHRDEKFCTKELGALYRSIRGRKARLRELPKSIDTESHNLQASESKQNTAELDRNSRSGSDVELKFSKDLESSLPSDRPCNSFLMQTNKCAQSSDVQVSIPWSLQAQDGAFMGFKVQSDDQVDHRESLLEPIEISRGCSQLKVRTTVDELLDIPEAHAKEESFDAAILNTTVDYLCSSLVESSSATSHSTTCKSPENMLF